MTNMFDGLSKNAAELELMKVSALLEENYWPLHLYPDDPDIGVIWLPIINLCKVDHTVFEITHVHRVPLLSGVMDLPRAGNERTYYSQVEGQPGTPCITVFEWERRDPNEIHICTYEGCKICRLNPGPCTQVEG